MSDITAILDTVNTDGSVEKATAKKEIKKALRPLVTVTLANQTADGIKVVDTHTTSHYSLNREVHVKMARGFVKNRIAKGVTFTHIKMESDLGVQYWNIKEGAWVEYTA